MLHSVSLSTFQKQERNPRNVSPFSLHPPIESAPASLPRAQHAPLSDAAPPLLDRIDAERLSNPMIIFMVEEGAPGEADDSDEVQDGGRDGRKGTGGGRRDGCGLEGVFPPFAGGRGEAAQWPPRLPRAGSDRTCCVPALFRVIPPRPASCSVSCLRPHVWLWKALAPHGASVPGPGLLQRM